MTSKLEALADRMDALTKEADAITKEIYALIQKQTVPRDISIDSIEKQFTEEQIPFLAVTDEGSYIRVEFTEFKSKDMFADVAKRVTGMGGEWISDGKNSHFKIPK